MAAAIMTRSPKLRCRPGRDRGGSGAKGWRKPRLVISSADMALETGRERAISIRTSRAGGAPKTGIFDDLDGQEGWFTSGRARLRALCPESGARIAGLNKTVAPG
jgi:hypothetical protein